MSQSIAFDDKQYRQVRGQMGDRLGDILSQFRLQGIEHVQARSRTAPPVERPEEKSTIITEKEKNNE